jgi:hypothetical protein
VSDIAVTSSVRDTIAPGHARDYLSGLTGTQRRKNIEKRKKDIFKFVYVTQPANEISTDGNLTGRESHRTGISPDITLTK